MKNINISHDRSGTSDSKEPSLFHYTPEFSYLRDMLRNGLWPRYCIEEFDWLLGGNICIAMPMACFCDIPRRNANDHGNRYGFYAVSLHKRFAGELNINPIWYMQEGTTPFEEMRRHARTRPRVTLETMRPLLKANVPYLKPTIGAQPCRIASGSTEVLAFEEEMEWRFCPPELASTWTFGYGRDSLEPLNHELSLSLRLLVSPNQIDQVFVRSETERKLLELEFGWLVGRIVVW